MRSKKIMHTASNAVLMCILNLTNYMQILGETEYPWYVFTDMIVNWELHSILSLFNQIVSIGRQLSSTYYWITSNSRSTAKPGLVRTQHHQMHLSFHLSPTTFTISYSESCSSNINNPLDTRAQSLLTNNSVQYHAFPFINQANLKNTLLQLVPIQLHF